MPAHRRRSPTTVSVVEVVDDLITLQALTEREADAASRKMLASLQRRVAERDRGAKVSEAAAILGLSAPTVRSWITAGVLPVTGTAPVRVDLLALADAKRAVDSLRRHADDAHLLADVLRLLRDRAVALPERISPKGSPMRTLVGSGAWIALGSISCCRSHALSDAERRRSGRSHRHQLTSVAERQIRRLRKRRAFSVGTGPLRAEAAGYVNCRGRWAFTASTSDRHVCRYPKRKYHRNRCGPHP